MPKRENQVPEKLRPYLFHGLHLNYRKGDTNAVGDCPLCGNKKGKFGVKIVTGEYNCHACGGSGNSIFDFINWLLKDSEEKTTEYDELAANRGLVYPETLIRWGISKSSQTNEWLIPGYNVEGKLAQLYRYVKTPNGMIVMATPGLGHQIFGMSLYDSSKPLVCICEGVWDGMILWELLKELKDTENGLVPTSNESKSLLSTTNVLAIPGCGSVGKPFIKWLSLFSDKVVNLLFDNDYPREHPKTGKTIEPAAFAALRRASGLLSGCSKPPAEIHYLHWGDEGYDVNLKKGMDIRDLLNVSDRKKALERLLERITEIPDKWLKERNSLSVTDSIQCVPCSDYNTLITSWRKALKWTSGLDKALSVMLASITSTRSVGDQLWVKVISPASSGKSSLCEALSVARTFIYPKDTFTGLTSGYQTDAAGKENMSLVDKLHNKTLLINDGDTLLQLPNLNQVLSQMRTFYGRNIRSQYKNKMSKDHEGINTTIIICGTSSLRGLDSSELGSRFLDCIIMEGIDDELEDEVLWRVANRANKNVKAESDGKPESQQSVEMVDVMGLTGGYVEYLRINAHKLLGEITASKDALILCTKLGKFVAYMRARPSKTQSETSEREFGARLVEQHVRLANCLAVVRNKKTLDEQVMNLVKSVAIDTSRGQTLDIVNCLAQVGFKGLEPKGIRHETNRGWQEVNNLLKFLVEIGVIEKYKRKVGGVSKTLRYRLTTKLARLYQEVVYGNNL